MRAKTLVTRQEPIARTILALGSLLYLALCMPAIGRRGYPPIDPFWMAMTFWWVCPLLLSCWFDTWPFPSRKWQLAMFAVGTGFIDALTSCTVVPRMVNPIFAVFETVFLYGPIHLAVTFLLEAAIQAVLGCWRTVTNSSETAPDGGGFQISLLGWMYCFTVICLSVGFPFAGRTLAFSVEQRVARARADADWKSGTPVIFRDPQEFTGSQLMVDRQFDPATGFSIHLIHPDWGYRKAYNQRIQELMAESASTRPLPKPSIPTTDELLALLDSPELEELNDFPCDLTPAIVVSRGGSHSGRGSTTTYPSGALLITTRTMS